MLKYKLGLIFCSVLLFGCSSDNQYSRESLPVKKLEIVLEMGKTSKVDVFNQIGEPTQEWVVPEYSDWRFSTCELSKIHNANVVLITHMPRGEGLPTQNKEGYCGSPNFYQLELSFDENDVLSSVFHR